ncbi:uncharacterized protein LY89DRAFT_722114 [Mollisia scopiformis]|uniref:Uncharacterized protein n=1 Tax=Mollisia scopiformis TaxID=149040 RepID=A0A194WX10_MOLSC|nr:uncharacterized protein LY89DRAFT_722114 [Mollisia scopiformis]KUJ12516.1 hypothetical protein LY89DRAFT_722114 [Mollisia scopiformis]
MRSFRVPDTFLYTHRMLSEFFRGTPSFSLDMISNELRLHITHFLTQNIPLYPFPNAQHGNHPPTPRGTIIIPLCQHTALFHPGSPHWAAYQQLIPALRSTVTSLSTWFCADQPDVYASAKRYLVNLGNGSNIIPGMTGANDMNCFLTMRLSVNTRNAPARLMTSHESPWTAVTFVGDYVGGKIKSPLLDDIGLMGRVLGVPDDVLFVVDWIPIGQSAFTGTRYQLELFVPPVGEKGEGVEEPSAEEKGRPKREDKGDRYDDGEVGGSKAQSVVPPWVAHVLAHGAK